MNSNLSNQVTSNLSKIKTKLRTTGNVTGNFGKQKVRTNGNTNLGLTNKKNIRVTSQDEYLKRMYQSFDKTNDPRLKKFIYNEIRQIMVQRGLWTD